jgi:hypothetical protein
MQVAKGGNKRMDTNSDVPRPLTSAKRSSWVTPARCLFFLLAVEAMLYASEQYQWFAFNRQKNWTVLITIAVTAGGILLMAGWFCIRLMLRRPFQFNLATMFLLMPVLAIPCAWIANAKRGVAEERVAIEWLEDRQGPIDYRTHAGTGGYSLARRLHFSRFLIVGSYCGPRDEPEWLRSWMTSEFFDRQIKSIRIGDRFPISQRHEKPEFYKDEQYDLTDQELARLRCFYDLEDLEISSRKITDKGLVSIHGLRRLRTLTLVAPKVTPKGIAELRRHLPRCEIIQREYIVVPVAAVDGG